MNTAWLQFFKPINNNARYRLYCFPYAGGGAMAFRSWSMLFSDDIEVCAIQLPGRENRINESSMTDIYEISRRIAYEIIENQVRDKPFAFLGHSMGSLVSFEVVRYLRMRGYQLPGHIFLSSMNAPENTEINRYIHRLPDDEFIELINSLNGTPKEFFNDSRIQELFLPILRSDFKAVELYKYNSEEPFSVPITVLGGEDDKLISIQGLKRWRRETNSTFSLKLFQGDHFYFQNKSGREVINYVTKCLLR